MALKGVSTWGCSSSKPHPQLGVVSSHSGHIGNNLRYDLHKCCKWECCCLGVLAQRAITPVEDEKSSSSPLVESPGAADQPSQNESKGFHKDMNLLPSELLI